MKDIIINFEINENTYDFTLDDITYSGGALYNLVGTGKTYTAFIPNGENICSISVGKNKFKNEFGNSNKESNVFSFTYDISKPKITITSDVIKSGKTHKNKKTLFLLLHQIKY